MRVDWQTLHDLGILEPGGSEPSLFDWVNFTRTSGGTQLLKERFRKPLVDVSAIRETQAAVAWLVGHSQLFDTLLAGRSWKTLEQYIGSSSNIAFDYPNRLFLWLDSWWVRQFHADLYREVLAALSMAQLLVRNASAVADQLRSTDSLPALLTGWVDEVLECVESPALLRLRSGQDVHLLRPPSVLTLDRALRTVEFAPLRRLAHLIYQADVLVSLALATREHHLVLPEVVEEEELQVEAEGLYHPLLREPVANPLSLGSDSRLMFLTGPNMAGKSTYIKAVGVSVYLGQIGMGVPARRFRFKPFECLFSGINTTDNLRLGQSYFYGEVRRVREITGILTDGVRSLVLFDEMFKGTNLKDASDACLAVLSGFAACDRSAFIIASHIAELSHGAETLSGVTFRCFGADVRDGEVLFDYQIRDGVSTQRLGMLILEREGVLRQLQDLRDCPVSRPGSS